MFSSPSHQIQESGANCNLCKVSSLDNILLRTLQCTINCFIANLKTQKSTIKRKRACTKPKIEEGLVFNKLMFHISIHSSKTIRNLQKLMKENSFHLKLTFIWSMISDHNLSRKNKEFNKSDLMYVWSTFNNT